MQYRPLGKSNIQASVIGMGTWAIGGWMWGGTNFQEAVDGIHAALDNGINLIDTAPVYGFGLSEEIVGEAIRGRRDKVVLATKCGLVWDKKEGDFHFHTDQYSIQDAPTEKEVYRCLSPNSIRKELENSLIRLQTDYIDLYQTHWQESTTPIEETMAELLRMKDQGKIRAIGVSNASVDQMEAYGPIDSDQEKFSMLDRGARCEGQLDYCMDKNIAFLAYSPLSMGLLTGKITPERHYGQGDLRTNRFKQRFEPEFVVKINAMLEQFKPVALAHNATVAQVVIAWTFSQPGVSHVLCGIRHADQANQNAAAGSIALSESDLKLIDSILDQL